MPIEKFGTPSRYHSYQLIPFGTSHFQISAILFFSDGGWWSRGIASECLLRARLRSCMLPAPCLRTFRGLSDTQPGLSVYPLSFFGYSFRSEEHKLCAWVCFSYRMMKGRLQYFNKFLHLILPRLFIYHYQSLICSRPSHVNVIKLSGDSEHLCLAWLVFGGRVQVAPDTC